MVARERANARMPLFVHSNRESLMQILNKVLYSATRMIKMKMKWNWNGEWEREGGLGEWEREGGNEKRDPKKQQTTMILVILSRINTEKKANRTRYGTEWKRRTSWNTEKCCIQKSWYNGSDGALHAASIAQYHQPTQSRAHARIRRFLQSAPDVLLLPRE